MQGYNPFNKWKLGFKPLQAAPKNIGGNLTPANSKVAGPDRTLDADGKKYQSLQHNVGSAVTLPANLYAPPGSQSLELTVSYFVPAASPNFEIMKFVAPQGMMTQILGYAFTSADPINLKFTPTVNNARVLPFHGNPDPAYGYAIMTPTGPDISSPIEAQLTLKPGDVFRWLASNPTLGALTGSIRTTGYLISSIPFEDTRFGG